MYFVVTHDGETLVSAVTREQLEERLNSGYYGALSLLSHVPDIDPVEWQQFAGDGAGSVVGIIIRGDIIMPVERRRYEVLEE